MRLFSLALLVSTWAWACSALVIDTASLGLHDNQLAQRADPSLAGYLGVFFLGADPYVYFYLSNGNNPISFKALNKGSPIFKPTKGTGGVRDPTIVPGGGSEAGKKWYIIGTDLNIGKVCHCHQWVATAVDVKYGQVTDHAVKTDNVGRSTTKGLQGDFRLGKHRSDQLGQREFGGGRGQYCWHGLGT